MGSPLFLRFPDFFVTFSSPVQTRFMPQQLQRLHKRSRCGNGASYDGRFLRRAFW